VLIGPLGLSGAVVPTHPISPGQRVIGAVFTGQSRQVLGAAVEDHRIPRNPCDGVKLPKSEHADRGYLSHAQVAALAAAVGWLPEVIRFLACCAAA
jgi:hypothetical protein